MLESAAGSESARGDYSGQAAAFQPQIAKKSSPAVRSRTLFFALFFARRNAKESFRPRGQLSFFFWADWAANAA